MYYGATDFGKGRESWQFLIKWKFSVKKKKKKKKTTFGSVIYLTAYG